MGNSQTYNGTLKATWFAEPEQALSLVNGANNNLNLVGAWSRISGPTGAFSVTGLANGADGLSAVIYNSTSQVMTVSNESASSTTTNRITTGTGADVVLPAGPSYARFKYDPTSSRWILLGYTQSSGSSVTWAGDLNGSSNSTQIVTALSGDGTNHFVAVAGNVALNYGSTFATTGGIHRYPNNVTAAVFRDHLNTINVAGLSFDSSDNLTLGGSNLPGNLVLSGGSASTANFSFNGTVRASIEPTHGAGQFGGAGSDFKGIIGPDPGAATSMATLHLLPQATSASGTNYSLGGDASNTYLNHPSGIWIAINNAAQCKITTSQFSLSAPLIGETSNTSPFAAHGFTAVTFTSGGTYTLSASEAAKTFLDFSGTVCAANSTVVIAAPGNGWWKFCRLPATDNTKTFTVKATTGTGPALTPGSDYIVFCDGTNCHSWKLGTYL